MRRTRSCRCALGAVLSAALAGGCEAGPPPMESTRTLTVFAATSLREAFSEVGRAVEHQHDAHIVFNFAGTQELRRQLEQGARCDVFASADRRQMDQLVRAGLVRDPLVFAHNRLVLVVEHEASERVRSLADLPALDRLVLAAPEVPLGAYTAELLTRAEARLGAGFAARVQARVVSRELNAGQVLAKVKLGEAEAGIVYRSDALRAAELDVLELPIELQVLAEYPIAVAAGAAEPDLARAFVERLRSPPGQAALERAGLTPVATGG